MFEFIAENLSTILISAVLLAAVVLICVKMVRDRKEGKSGCGCRCSECPASVKCSK